jgi:hypothetical protein
MAFLAAAPAWRLRASFRRYKSVAGRLAPYWPARLDCAVRYRCLHGPGLCFRSLRALRADAGREAGPHRLRRVFSPSHRHFRLRHLVALPVGNVHDQPIGFHLPNHCQLPGATQAARAERTGAEARVRRSKRTLDARAFRSRFRHCIVRVDQRAVCRASPGIDGGRLFRTGSSARSL